MSESRMIKVLDEYGVEQERFVEMWKTNLPTLAEIGKAYGVPVVPLPEEANYWKGWRCIFNDSDGEGYASYGIFEARRDLNDECIIWLAPSPIISGSMKVITAS